MKKELKDYLHLYLGCGVKSLDGGTSQYSLVGINYDGTPKFKTGGYAMEIFKYKLILRPLSSMTEEEARELYILTVDGDGDAEYQAVEYYRNNPAFYEPTEIIYLLSKHFDLFGLIESGQAIDKTEIN